MRSVAVLDDDGTIVAFGPGPVAADSGVAVTRLWEDAARRAEALGDAPLDHVIVPVDEACVAVVAHAGRRIAALTGPQPAVGLLLFDLRTCLGDAAEVEEESS